MIKRKPKWELKRASTQYKKLGMRKIGNDIWKMERHGIKYSSVSNKLPSTLIFVSKKISNPSSLHFLVLKKIKLTKYECLIFDHLCSVTNYMQINKSNTENIHCAKSVQMRSYFWSIFSCIQIEYGDLLRKSPYSIRIQENTDQK